MKTDAYVLENIEGIASQAVLDKLQLWKPWPGHADGWPAWYRWDGGWYECEGETTRYCVFDLNENSVVFDVGGYEGEWTRRMVERYDCTVHLFEPTPRAFKVAQEKLAGRPRVYLHQYALGPEDGAVTFHDCDRDGASVYGEGGPVLELPISSFVGALDRLGVQQVDMMSLNIEGGEYDLLPHMLDTGIIQRVREMMIQWHWREEGDDKRQRAIQERIAKTHRMRWNHAAWEAWRKKK